MRGRRIFQPRVGRPAADNGNAFGRAENYPNWKSFCVTLTRESLHLRAESTRDFSFFTSTWPFLLRLKCVGRRERKSERRLKDAERERSTRNKFLYISALRARRDDEILLGCSLALCVLPARVLTIPD